MKVVTLLLAALTLMMVPTGTVPSNEGPVEVTMEEAIAFTVPQATARQNAVRRSVGPPSFSKSKKAVNEIECDRHHQVRTFPRTPPLHILHRSLLI